MTGIEPLEDDFNGTPIRRALAQFVHHLPEIQCQHGGFRVAALSEFGSWCIPCARREGLARRWATTPVCMGCGRFMTEPPALYELPLADAGVLCASICERCESDLMALGAEFERKES